MFIYIDPKETIKTEIPNTTGSGCLLGVVAVEKV